ncbi:MAG: GTPase [Oscillospiraceae bacterium]|nr:GTPase [Oscillospiraceae bacterium]
MAKELPVYLFTGFLEAGKTKTIQETLADKEFNTGERILLVSCEEGIEEYDPSEFAHPDVVIETVEDPGDLSEALLKSFEKKHDPKLIMVEYNGMWMLDLFYRSLPENWVVYQEMLFIDATTVKTYNANMRTQMVDKLQSCEMVLFNRVPEQQDMMELHQLVRTISRRAAIAYEYLDGRIEYDEIEDPLPFDIDAPIIEIKDGDYAEWYRDLSEEMRKYDGKTVRFKGMVARGGGPFESAFAVGRHVMTCCAADITYRGVVCTGWSGKKLKTKDWVLITAKIKIAYHKLYDAEGPVLTAIDVQEATPPDPVVATFY